jgi:hypothetical protein
MISPLGLTLLPTQKSNIGIGEVTMWNSCYGPNYLTLTSNITRSVGKPTCEQGKLKSYEGKKDFNLSTTEFSK